MKPSLLKPPYYSLLSTYHFILKKLGFEFSISSSWMANQNLGNKVKSSFHPVKFPLFTFLSLSLGLLAFFSPRIESLDWSFSLSAQHQQRRRYFIGKSYRILFPISFSLLVWSLHPFCLCAFSAFRASMLTVFWQNCRFIFSWSCVSIALIPVDILSDFLP